MMRLAFLVLLCSALLIAAGLHRAAGRPAGPDVPSSTSSTSSTTAPVCKCETTVPPLGQP